MKAVWLLDSEFVLLIIALGELSPSHLHSTNLQGSKLHTLPMQRSMKAIQPLDYELVILIIDLGELSPS